MRRGFFVSTEFSFLVAGLAIIAMAWVANLVGVFSGGSGDSHGGMDTYFWFLFLLQGIAFAAVGAAYDHHRRLMSDSAFAKRYLVGYLFILDGAIHLLAFNEHVIGSTFAALFFEVVAPVQIALGVLIPHLRSRFDFAWLGLTLFLIAAYAVTRTIAIWPIGEVEAVDPLGMISKALEVVTAAALVSLIWVARTEKARSHPAAPTGGP